MQTIKQTSDAPKKDITYISKFNSSLLDISENNRSFYICDSIQRSDPIPIPGKSIDVIIDDYIMPGSPPKYI